MAGIAKALETIQDIGQIVVDVASILKSGVSFSTLPHLLAILNDTRELVSDAKAALPELSDVDPVEAGQMATAAYVQVQRIVAAVVG